jgi:hypothetical protein
LRRLPNHSSRRRARRSSGVDVPSFAADRSLKPRNVSPIGSVTLAA